MTTLDTASLLHEWFSKHDTFNMDKNFSGVVLVSETPEADKAALSCGLKKWEEMSIIQRHEDYWVLNRSLLTFEQSITVNIETAEAVSAFTMKYAEIIGDTKYYCDPTALEEKDVQALIGLCGDLIQSNEK